jgi:hypothetical protein
MHFVEFSTVEFLRSMSEMFFLNTVSRAVPSLRKTPSKTSSLVNREEEYHHIVMLNNMWIAATFG